MSAYVLSHLDDLVDLDGPPSATPSPSRLISPQQSSRSLHTSGEIADEEISPPREAPRRRPGAAVAEKVLLNSLIF